MAKFLNKKEQVYDLQLTSYGKYTLSIGSFKPTYYAFYDDNITYDKDYARTSGSVAGLSGTAEPQKEIHKRIKQDTQYLESLILFEDIEEAKEIISWEDGHFNTDINPVRREPRKDIFRYNSAIGDAYLDGDSNVAPAWKIVTLQGEITSVDLEDAVGSTRVPQINIQANYTKRISNYGINTDPSSFEDVIGATEIFADGNQIELVAEDILVYGEELNTELLLENFDVEVYEFAGDTAQQASGSIEILEPVYVGDTVTINDGFGSTTFEFVTNGATGGMVYQAAPTTTPPRPPNGSKQQSKIQF
jgi:predicted HicB family RNase H-like nuclease